MACGGTEAPPAGYAAPASRPHVLVYLVDTLRADHLGVYGYQRDTSPNLDRLAREGIVFDSAYAPSSWTRTSTASLLTGLDPVEHGVVSRRHRLPPRLTLASEHLSELGYRTHALVTNPHVVEHWGFDQGFDRFVDLGATGDGWVDVDAGQVNEEARELLPRAGDPPTFVYVHTIDPHGPNDPDEPYRSLFTDEPRPALRVGRLAPDTPADDLDNLVALYDAEIRFNDDRFGELVEELRRRGVYDDTLIVFTSDHGEEHLEHGRGGHGQQLFEEVVRVPLVVKLPGGELAGRRVEAPASLVDVLPTVLAAAGGAPPPEELHGVDLARLAAEPSALPERPLFLDLELVRHDGVLHVARGVVYKRRKYIEEVLPEPRRMLFDLRSDPAERNDLAAAEPETAERLEEMLREHREDHDEGLHLRFVGPPDGDARVVEGRLGGAATFRDVQGRRLEEGDRVSVEAGGGGVSFELRLASFARRGFGDAGERLQDIDGLLLRTEPAGAEVRLESLRAPGLPIRLGPDRRPAPAPPFGLAALDPALAIPTVGRLFRSETAAGEPLPPGLYVVAVPPLDRLESDEIPEHLQERFEALGYL